MGSIAPPRVIRFGAFKVDLYSGELFKNSRKIIIQEQPFRILAALLEHPGDLVTREEIHRRLWTQSTFVDFDHSINSAVRLLRLALGDCPEHPQFIETLPRKGYRFIYPVDQAGETGAEIAQSSRPNPRTSEAERHPDTLEDESFPQSPLRQLHWRAWAVISFSALLAVVGTVYWKVQQRTPQSERILLPFPLIDYPGSARQPSFSPDGSQVAFVWTGERQDNSDIYVKQIGIESLRRLTTDLREDVYPAWSPDGLSIAFLRSLGPDRVMVLSVPAIGGAERQVEEFRMPWAAARGLCWHPGGKWLAITCYQDFPEAPPAIFLLSLETHERRKLTFPPKGVSLDTNPAFSPDGRTLAFVRYSTDSMAEIYLLPVSAGLLPEGAPRQLSSLNQDTFDPVWMPDGKEILFVSGSKSHACRMWRIPVLGQGKPKSLSSSLEGSVIFPAVSMGKNRLAYSIYTEDSTIWRCGIPRREGEAELPRRLFASIRHQERVQYSPDGLGIAYVGWASGSGEIWVANCEGANPLQLTHLGGPTPESLRWSPDGQLLVFHMASKGQSDLYLIPAQGGELRQLTHTPFHERRPSFSRDGKWIYFSADRSGDYQVWKMPAEGGEAMQVSQRGGYSPLESMDGKMLFYLKKIKDSDLKGELWRMPLNKGEETRVLEEVWYGNFDLKPRGIYYASRSEANETAFLFYPFARSRTEIITRIQKPVGPGFSVSPDERYLLYVQQGDLGRCDLMLAENFH